MAKSSLVIVESPTKAKTIRKFLPKTFMVEASMGHVRDLPQSATDIPADLKKEEWTKLGVNVEKDFEPLYVVPKGKSKIITELRRKLKEADALYLATDEDREGESISWHLLQILKPKCPVYRMVFHEITKPAIEKALKEVRQLDEKLVRAQETRRILDRLYGYTLSPLIWKKIAYGLSAGRVQSVGLRLIVGRERERMAFKSAQYWDLESQLEKAKSPFGAKLHSVNGTRIASGKDFDETTGKLKADSEVKALGQDEAKDLLKKVESATWKVASVDEKSFQSKPLPPFITSTLQQEGNRKLGLSARETMRVAQRLYEEGLITYMRTDSPNLSQEALQAARAQVEDLFGKQYLSPEPRQFTAKAKGAQEAHEAIRPAGAEFVHPAKTDLGGMERALYELIWMRTLASQMAEAKKLSISVKIEAGPALFATSGTRVIFPGFLQAYKEGRDEKDGEEDENVLPDLKAGDVLKLLKLEAVVHETKPPARFTEASIIQTLEKEGIGRPSTYATIIQTIIDRGYVRKVGNALVPTFTGIGVIQLLERHFAELVDLGFTSEMERALDEIAEGEREWLPYLKKFYLGKDGLQTHVKSRDKSIDPTESRSIHIEKLKGVDVKIGRYGAYLVKEGAKKADEDAIHASIPEDIAPADLTAQQVEDLLIASEKGPQSLGVDPKTGLKVYCLLGRFGPYLQLGEVTDEQPKPKRASIPKQIDYKTISFEQALMLVHLPRELGMDPKTNKMVVAGLGRFGPYIHRDGEYRSIKQFEQLFTITLDEALAILAEEKKGRGNRSKLLKELGQHPEDQKPIGVYEGKYGPYVKHGSNNATVPKEKKPEDVTLEDALKLLAERAALKGGKGAKKTAGATKTKGKAKKSKEAPAEDEEAEDSDA